MPPSSLPSVKLPLVGAVVLFVIMEYADHYNDDVDDDDDDCDKSLKRSRKISSSVPTYKYSTSPATLYRSKWNYLHCNAE